MAFVLTLTIAFAGSGCGQKGPLFLPGTSGTTHGVVGAAAGSASAAAR